MIVLESRIDRVHRDRNFNRIEARVTFLAKTVRGQPPRRIAICTNQPTGGAAPLRDRLIADAARLFRARLARVPGRSVA